MPELSRDTLNLMALEALEAVVSLAKHEPIEKTRSLAFILAYLASLQPCERWPFDSFWRDCASNDPNGRPAGMSASLNAIYRTVGVNRTLAMQGKYEKLDARKSDRPKRNWGG